MQTVTLKGSDFSTIHNALCDLRSFSFKLENASFNNEPLEKIIERFEKGLRDCYDQDNDFFNRRHDYYCDVQAENGFISIWSLYDISDLTLPHCYGENMSVHYNGCVAKVEGHTWIDLWRAADKVIVESGDSDHIFIETFLRDQDTVLILSTGS